jgi:hypothetical protein
MAYSFPATYAGPEYSMSVLLVVGGGLFGSPAAAYARIKGIEAMVFDPVLRGAASHAAAGLFKESWAGRKLALHYQEALPLLDRLYGLRKASLAHDDGSTEELLFVPPGTIMEASPIREEVTAVGDGWVETRGKRLEGWVYVAAGIWCGRFLPGLSIHGRAGASFAFPGERQGRIQPLARGRQAIAFVRDRGQTYFSDGTAARDYSSEHERETLARAAEMCLTQPSERFWGQRPYTPGGPVFRRLGNRLWLATGGRKMGTILGASFARKLVDEELRGSM